MGRSGRSLDMLDCLLYLNTLDRTAGSYTTIVLLPSGSLKSPHVVFCLLTVHKQAKLGETSAVSTMFDGWPSTDYETFESAFFAAIAEHDKGMERGWMVGG